jgi:hypothetical protein
MRSERASSGDRIDAGLLPPSGFITTSLDLAVSPGIEAL